ncbi:MAG: gamma-glutamyl-gamma-aminobutyrate hydrolase family protein [Bacillota bacterium]
MTLLIGVSSAWSNETWGEDTANPHGYIYTDQPYAQAIYRSGAVPLLLAPPVDKLSAAALSDLAATVLDSVNGLLLTGGGGARRFKPEHMPGLQEQQPLRYRYEMHLIREAWRRRMPVLGFCRGHQMMAEVLGGKIRKQPVSGHQQPADAITAHSVDLVAQSMLSEITGTLRWEVNSYHCQVVETVPADFQVCARSPEGWIEAMEAATGPFWLGCQFHPELLFDDDQKARSVFERFIARSGRRI